MGEYQLAPGTRSRREGLDEDGDITLYATAVVQPAYQMDVIATDLLIEQILGEQRESQEVVLEPRILLPGRLHDERSSMLSLTSTRSTPLQRQLSSRQ